MFQMTHLLPLAALVTLLPPPTASPSPASPGTREGETIEDFRWLTGCWRKTGEGQQLEESWGEPLGNSMTGTFRWLKKGEGWVYEFLLIEKSEKDELGSLKSRVDATKSSNVTDLPVP